VKESVQQQRNENKRTVKTLLNYTHQYFVVQSLAIYPAMRFFLLIAVTHTTLQNK